MGPKRCIPLEKAREDELKNDFDFLVKLLRHEKFADDLKDSKIPLAESQSGVVAALVRLIVTWSNDTNEIVESKDSNDDNKKLGSLQILIPHSNLAKNGHGPIAFNRLVIKCEYDITELAKTVSSLPCLFDSIADAPIGGGGDKIGKHLVKVRHVPSDLCGGSLVEVAIVAGGVQGENPVYVCPHEGLFSALKLWTSGKCSKFRTAPANMRGSMEDLMYKPNQSKAKETVANGDYVKKIKELIIKGNSEMGKDDRKKLGKLLVRSKTREFFHVHDLRIIVRRWLMILRALPGGCLDPLKDAMLKARTCAQNSLGQIFEKPKDGISDQETGDSCDSETVSGSSTSVSGGESGASSEDAVPARLGKRKRMHKRGKLRHRSGSPVCKRSRIPESSDESSDSSGSEYKSSSDVETEKAPKITIEGGMVGNQLDIGLKFRVRFQSGQELLINNGCEPGQEVFVIPVCVDGDSSDLCLETILANGLTRGSDASSRNTVSMTCGNIGLRFKMILPNGKELTIGNGCKPDQSCVVARMVVSKSMDSSILGILETYKSPL